MPTATKATKQINVDDQVKIEKLDPHFTKEWLKQTFLNPNLQVAITNRLRAGQNSAIGTVAEHITGCWWLVDLVLLRGSGSALYHESELAHF